MLGLTDTVVFSTILTTFTILGWVRAVVSNKCMRPRDVDTNDEDADKWSEEEDDGNQCHHRWKQRSRRDYLLGISHWRVISATLSMFASFVSATSLIGIPAAVYQNGPHYFIIIFTFFLSVSFANFVVVPVMVQHQFKTTSQYLERRFSQTVARTAIALFIVNSLFTNGLWLAVPTRVLDQLADIGWGYSLLTTQILVVSYAAFGGMTTIVFAHAFQTILLVFSYLTVVVKGSTIMGGMGSVFSKNIPLANRSTTDIHLDPTTTWSSSSSSSPTRSFFDMEFNPLLERATTPSLFFGYIVFWSMTYTTNQSVLSRYQPASSLKKAKLILWLQVPLMMAMFTLCYLTGVIMFSFYHGCDPFLTKRVETTEEFVPLFVHDVGSHVPGFVGLWLTGIFSASLSTIASSLNAVVTVTNEHFFQPMMMMTRREDTTSTTSTPSSNKSEGQDKEKSSLETQTKSTTQGMVPLMMEQVETWFRAYPLLPIRLFAILLSFLVLGSSILSLLVFQDSLKARMLFANTLSCPVFGMFLLGLLVPSCGSKGALTGLTFGILTGASSFISHFYAISLREGEDYAPAPDVSVIMCPQLYCIVQGESIPASTPLLGYNKSHFSFNSTACNEMVTELINTNVPSLFTGLDAMTIFRLSPQVGGIMSVLVTVVVASISTHWLDGERTDEEESRVGRLVTTFLQHKQKKKKNNIP